MISRFPYGKGETFLENEIDYRNIKWEIVGEDEDFFHTALFIRECLHSCLLLETVLLETSAVTYLLNFFYKASDVLHGF